ncbi:MAG: DnaJ domain-containing protein [Nitrospira sp.]
MAQTHTHYDNLKVARNAPPEVIRAAYRALSQSFHPDKTLGNSESARNMAIIHASYEVLSDPVKRREHDQWIKDVEAAGGYVKMETGQAVHSTTQTSHSVSSTLDRPLLDLVKEFVFRREFYVMISIGVLVGVWIIGDTIELVGGKSSPPPGPVPDYTVSPNPAPVHPTPDPIPHQPKSAPARPAPDPTPHQVKPAPARSPYVRPSTAPNGNPWPVSPGYVTGYPLLHTDGLSSVTVDNSRNDSDVFVKLVSLDGPQPYPVRQFYIPAFGSFTVSNVTAGRYDIRYRDLNTGTLTRSDARTLQENPTYGSTQYTITLYKVLNGNLHTYGLSEKEF